MKVNVYMCSKPLQYFNIKNIGKIDNSTFKKILCIRNDFIEAEKFVNRIRLYDKEWDEVIFLKNKKEYHQFIRKTNIHNLIAENDASWLMWIHNLMRHFENFYVFEEGIGTYKVIQRKWWDKTLRALLGVGSHYGQSKYCKGVFLYEPELYNKKFSSQKALSMKQNFWDGLVEYADLFAKLSPPIPEFLNVKDKRILIYVTNHEVSDKIIESMNHMNGYDLLIIKPHPHLKNICLKSNKIHILYTNMMMEYILYQISKNNTLEVWHFASTSMIYFANKIKNINFGHFPIYDEFIEHLNNKI